VTTCQTPSNSEGKCIPLDHCPSILRLINSGNLRDADVEFLQNSQCDYVMGNPWVCCSDKIDFGAASNISPVIPCNGYK
jgi:hypothetical protein